MKKVFLLSTEHLEDSLWFRDDEDYKVGMNYVAANICAHASQYPWGSGNSIFLPGPLRGTPFGSLTMRAKRRLFQKESFQELGPDEQSELAR